MPTGVLVPARCVNSMVAGVVTSGTIAPELLTSVIAWIVTVKLTTLVPGSSLTVMATGWLDCASVGVGVEPE